MFYKDGSTEPKKGDTVLGDRIKGQVAGITATKVVVKLRAPSSRSKPFQAEAFLVEKDSSLLELVYRPK